MSIFNNLDASFSRRLSEARDYRTEDRKAGQERGEELFYEGSLGRVSQQLDPEFLKVLEHRTNYVVDKDLQEPMALQREEMARSNQDYNNLIAARNINSPEMTAARENAAINIQRALQGSLKQARAAGTEGGYSGGGQMADLEREANRNFALSRGNLERDLLLANLDAKESLVREAANVRAANINQLANLQIGEVAMQDTLTSRGDAIVMAAQDERLRRELINLENLRSEKFGAVGVEEALVQQGVSERGGLRQELVAEAGQAESARHAREMERIQLIEAQKEPPSGGGGGKSVMCVAMWKMGLISDEVLAADIKYCKQHIDDDTRRGYFFLSTPVAEACLAQGKDGWITKLFAPLTVGWAKEMASRQGEPVEGTLWGKVLCAVGVPICRSIGKILKLFGHTKIATESAREILRAAVHIDADVLGEQLDMPAKYYLSELELSRVKVNTYAKR